MGIIFLSFSPLFTHWAEAPGIITSFYRMLISTCVLLPFALKIFKSKEENKLIPLTFRELIIPILAGVFSALDHSFWSSAIKQTNVANATLLNYISPLWVSFVAIIVFKEKYKYYYWVGLLLVFFGSVSVLNIMHSNITFNFKGEGFAIISSFFYAGYFLLTQKGRTYLSGLQQLFISLLSSCITLGVIILILQLQITGYSRTTFLIFFLSAILSQFFGYFCLTEALGKIPASIVSPSLTLQPVVTALLAIPFANQNLVISQIIGGLLVLAGIIIINNSKEDTEIISS
jgi:drug/metabolite transporter (DMT)-like permease